MIPVFRNNPAPMRQLPLAGVDAEFMRFLDLRRRTAAGDEGMSARVAASLREKLEADAEFCTYCSDNCPHSGYWHCPVCDAEWPDDDTDTPAEVLLSAIEKARTA